MPALFQIDAQLGMVVDLTVEGDPDGAILITRRHVTRRGKIHDTQPTTSQPDAAVGTDPRAGIVGAAVSDGVAHRLQHGLIDAVASVENHFAANAAHSN